MEDLRKEFNDFMKQNQFDSCENGECETEIEEDYPDYIIELKEKMLSPQKVGIYFSKKDFREIGLATENSISLKQRDRMLTDLLKSIFTYEDMEKIFAVMNLLIDQRVEYYNELQTTFPHSNSFLDGHKNKALKLQKTLLRILEENKDVLRTD